MLLWHKGPGLVAIRCCDNRAFFLVVYRCCSTGHDGTNPGEKACVRESGRCDVSQGACACRHPACTCEQVAGLGLAAGLRPYWAAQKEDPSASWWAQDRAARVVYTKCARPVQVHFVGQGLFGEIVTQSPSGAVFLLCLLACCGMHVL